MDFLLSGVDLSASVKCFGVDLRRCVGSRPVLVSGPLLFFRPK